MADFLLDIGVDIKSSEVKIREGITQLVGNLSSNQPKIKVGLELDTSAITNLQTQIANLQNLINSSGGSGSGTGGSGSSAAKEYTASLQTVINTYTKMQSLINKNTNAGGLSSWGALSAQARQYADVIKEVEAKNISVKEALKNLGIDGKGFIEGASIAMAKFRAEMEATGISGGTSLKDMRIALDQMQMLLNSNSGASGMQSFVTLQNTANLFSEAIRLATTENISLKAALEQVGLSGTTAIDSATAAMTAFKTELAGSTTIKINSPEYFSDLNKVNTLLTQVTQNHTKWTAAKKGDTASHYNKLPEYANQLAVLREELRAGISPDEFNKRFGAILAGVSNVNTVIKSAGKNTLSWGDRIKGLAAKFSSWFSITRVIMAVYRTIRKMITSVIELDTAMTELKKVTNETDAGYSRFLDNATVRAKKLGASLTDVVNATADFARLGYGIKDAEKLADVAIMYKNVGDGIQDISEASESIIATMQAFGITADEAESIVDKFNEVGNNYAISSKGIGDALLRSAAAMHAANNTLDETIALATAANTVVQDPEKVGTTLKTVSMYLRAAKTEAEEAGESTDGMANSVSELREEILSLTGNRVDIQLDDGTFKSTYQILKELSEVWNGLSDITQANIVELVGGKRNANVVSALLENFEVAEKSLETSLNSAGSAARENEKVLESIQGKINKMKAAFQSLSKTIFNSELIKFVVDMLSWIIGATDAVLGFIGVLGGLPTVLTMVCSALIMTNNAFLANKAAVVGTFIVQKATALFKGVASAAKLIYNSLINAGIAWNNYAAGVYTANQVMQASIPVIGLAIGALTLIGSIIGHNIKAEKEAAEAAKEKAEEARKNAEETKNNAKELDNLISKYKELAKTGGVSAVDAEEARQIQSDINSLITNQKTQIDLVNGSYDEQIKKLEYIKRLQGNEVADDAYNAYIGHTQSYITSDMAGERGWVGDATAWTSNHIPWAPAVNRFLGINPTPEDTGYVYYWDSPAFLSGDMNSGIIRQVISGVEGVDVTGDDSGIKWDSTKFTPSEMRDSLQKYVDALDKKAEEIKAGGGDASFIYESDEYQTFRRWLGEASKSADTQKQLAFDVVEGAFSQFTIGEVSSIQGYKDERTALVDNLLKDQRVQHLIKDKIISEEDIQKYVDGRLSIQFPKFAGAIARETSGLKPEAGIGAMKSASEAISTLQEANKQLSEDGYLTTDTLDKIRESANLSGEEWDRYFEKLMNAKAGSAEFNKTLDDLTYKILENELATTGLENATEEQIAAILRENGVANANTVAQQYLARAKFNAKMAGETFKNTTEESIAALVNEGLQCGLTQDQILALIATEIKFNRNDLNVEQKKKALMEVALAAGMAKAQVDAVFSGITNSSSGTDKKAWAEANGFDVLDKHTGENWTLDGVNYYSWAYRDRATGVVYDEIEPAQLEHAANETIAWLNDKANFEVPKYTSGESGGGENKALEDYLKAIEKAYKIHQNELRYISDLEYAYSNLAKTAEEQADILEKIEQARKDYAQNCIDDIEHQNDLLLRNGKTELDLIDNFRKIQEIAHTEANRLRALGYDDNSKEIQDLQNTWWDAYDSIKDATIEYFELSSDKLSSLQDLQESYYDVINSVAEAQHEITKELEASKTMYEYLDEETRKLLFNQEDYNKLSDELVDIQAQAEKLRRRYNQEISNATADNLDEITSKYQMQYELMMKQYEIAKAELEVAKKRQQLDNVLNERNVRMFIDGQWQWVANTQDVIDAQKELADAEYEADRARNEKAQTESLNNLTLAQDKLTTTINQIDSGAIKLDGAVGKITSALQEVADKDIPALRTILSSAANIASGASGGQSSGGSNDAKVASAVAKSSGSRVENNATATIPGLGTVGVHIDSNGKTTTTGLPAGTIVHTGGGDYVIKGGSGGNYEADKVKQMHAKGTKNTIAGSALMGEGGNREVFIDSNGHFIPIEQPTIFADINAGGKVFNGLQLKNLEMLWDLSNMSSLPSMLAGRAQSISTIDNSIHIGGMTIGEQGNEDWIDGLRRYVYTHKGSM